MRRYVSLLGNRFLLVAMAFELSLGLLGYLLSGWVGVNLWERRGITDHATIWPDVGLGVAAAVPFLVGLVVLDRYPLPFLETLARTVREDVVPLFRGTGVWGLLAIACAAGVGEELLFRGFLQRALADWWGAPAGPWLGWAVAALVFGLCHSLCVAYAVLATVMGLALGGLLLVTDRLTAPMVMHAVYDAVALVYLVRYARMKNGGSVLVTRAAVRLPD